MSDTSDSSKAAATYNAKELEHRRAVEGSTLTPERHDSRLEQDTDSTPTRANSRKTAADTEGATTSNLTAVAHNNAVLPSIDTSIAHPPLPHRTQPHSRQSSLNIGLSLQTNLDALSKNNHKSGGGSAALREPPPQIYETPVQTTSLNHSLTSPGFREPPIGSPLRSNLSTASMTSANLSPPSANSALPSPYLAAMTDLTPLPSPLVGSESPAPWRRQRNGSTSRPGSMDQSTPTKTSASLPTTPTTSPSKRKKGYGSLVSAAVEASIASNAAAAQENGQQTKHHTRNRSISDFVPEPLQNVRQRHVTFGPGDAQSLEAAEYHMHREAYLAAQRGLTGAPPDAAKALPSPPPSNTSVAESDEAEEDTPMTEDGEPAEYLQIHCGINNRKRKFRQLRQLGQGTFSKVMLATSERIPSSSISPDIEDKLDPARLVAVKVIEHGPAGGADEERIGTSLKREVDMLKSISHPSLVHLKACEYQDSRTLLVLTYCPGGDLFELASQKRDLLTPLLVQRMFSELVSAVRYLHQHWIVHRDIKLENVLVNLPLNQIRDLEDPRTCPTPIVTLTDLGLGRRMPDPPESPLLTTRCGSEDYAAPEILLGQPYDGRLTDGWALGVLLYALMEGRLPFDTPPGKPERSRNTHRIARCDWIWCRFGDEDGEWDSSRGSEWEGGRFCVEGLLKKVRMGRKPLEDIAAMDWVMQGIQVPGGLGMRSDDRELES